MTIYLTPLKDFAIDFDVKRFTAASGKNERVTAGSITAIVASSTESTAVAVDPTLASLSAVYSATPLKWSIEIDAAVLTTALLRRLFKAPALAGTLFSDTFTRANSALTMGAPWVVDPLGASLGMLFGIDTNQAYCVTFGTGAQAVCTVEWLVPDARLAFTVPVLGGGFAAAVRTVDALNGWAVRTDLAGSTRFLDLQSVTAGVATVVARVPYVAAAGDTITVDCVGTTITGTITRAGVSVAVLSYAGASQFLTASRFGVVPSNIATRFTNFSLATVTPPSPVLIITLPNGFRETVPLTFRDASDATLTV